MNIEAYDAATKQCYRCKSIVDRNSVISVSTGDGNKLICISCANEESILLTGKPLSYHLGESK